MSRQHYDHIRKNQEFHDLVAKRTRLSWTLAIMMLVVYYSFILIIAFSPGFFGIPVVEGATITWGIIIGIAIILFTFLLTGIYVYKANTVFDKLLRSVVDASDKHVQGLISASNEHGEG